MEKLCQHLRWGIPQYSLVFVILGKSVYTEMVEMLSVQFSVNSCLKKYDNGWYDYWFIDLSIDWFIDLFIYLFIYLFFLFVCVFVSLGDVMAIAY